MEELLITVSIFKAGVNAFSIITWSQPTGSKDSRIWFKSDLSRCQLAMGGLVVIGINCLLDRI